MDTHEGLVQCARIREKWNIIRQLQNRALVRDVHGKNEIFGANKHQFILDAPLNEEQVAAWETEAGVRLPCEYRLFLLHVGAAGAGPYYGLSPLPDWGEMADDAKTKYQRSLRAPCLYAEGMGEDWLEQAAGPDWEARWDNDTLDPQDGTLGLIEQGCGIETVLVLNGPHRGRVVNAYWDDPPHFAPYAHFLDYYEGWLDTLLARRAPGWYGYEAPGETPATPPA